MFHVKHFEKDSGPGPAVEPEPIAAAEIAGDRVDTLRAFSQDLALRGEELGLVGPRELSRIWTRHVLNSALLAPELGSGTLADIGSGAGLPGLVVAIIRPDIECTLIEPMERRVAWLSEQVELLQLKNVRVVRARAEDLHGKHTFDYVTARAVSALAKLIPLAAPLATTGGELMFMKGARVHEELQAAQGVATRAGLTDVRIYEVAHPGLAEHTTIFRAKVDR